MMPFIIKWSVDKNTHLNAYVRPYICVLINFLMNICSLCSVSLVNLIFVHLKTSTTKTGKRNNEETRTAYVLAITLIRLSSHRKQDAKNFIWKTKVSTTLSVRSVNSYFASFFVSLCTLLFIIFALILFQ